MYLSLGEVTSETLSPVGDEDASYWQQARNSMLNQNLSIRILFLSTCHPHLTHAIFA